MRIVDMLDTPPGLMEEYEAEWECVREALYDAGCDEALTESLVQEMRWDEESCPCCDEQDFYRWADQYLYWHGGGHDWDDLYAREEFEEAYISWSNNTPRYRHYCRGYRCGY